MVRVVNSNGRMRLFFLAFKQHLIALVVMIHCDDNKQKIIAYAILTGQKYIVRGGTSMRFEKHIKLSSGEILGLPERLYEIINAEKITHQVNIKPDEINEYLDIIIHSLEERFLESSHLALQIAAFLQGEERGNDYSILFLGLYADKNTQILSGQGNQEKAIQILSDVLEMEKVAFSDVEPAIARQLADLMIVQSENSIHICSLFGSIHTLALHAQELSCALDTASTFWEPEFSILASKIKKEFENFVAVYTNDFRSENVRKIYDAFFIIKKDFNRQAGRKQKKHLDTLVGLVDVLLEMLQQELLLNAHVKYTSDGLNSEVIQYQAKNLIEKVERRLRKVISKKYQHQFSLSWVRHIESKYKPMYERWQRYMKKDQAAFKLYDNYSPEILEYALIEDLRDLIAAQWHLFKDIFDFGHPDRNKAIFYDKIAQIISVRNTLAHHRSPPENELLRARVLCTDILLVLDRAGESEE